MGVNNSATVPLALDRNEFLFPHPVGVCHALAHPADFSHYAARSDVQDFCNRLSSFLAVELGRFAIGHGAEDLLLRLLLLHRRNRSLVVVPEFSWGEYERMSLSLGYDLVTTPMTVRDENPSTLAVDAEALGKKLCELPQDQVVVLLATTNNPTGSRMDPQTVLQLVEAFPRVVFILDGVYESLPSPLFFGPLSRRPQVHVLGSMSKFFGLPGLRLGFATGELPDAFHMALGHNSWTLAVARAALHEAGHYQDLRVLMTQAAHGLCLVPLAHLTVFRSAAPFVLVGTHVPLTSCAQLALQQACETKSGVRPKSFVHQGSFWMRFGLGPDSVVAAVSQFLTHWDQSVLKFLDDRPSGVAKSLDPVLRIPQPHDEERDGHQDGNPTHGPQHRHEPLLGSGQ